MRDLPTRVVAPALLVLALLAIWQLYARSGAVDAFILGNPPVAKTSLGLPPRTRGCVFACEGVVTQTADVDVGRGPLGEPGRDAGGDPVGRAVEPVRVEGEQAGGDGRVRGALRRGVLAGSAERRALVDARGPALHRDAHAGTAAQRGAPGGVVGRGRGLDQRRRQDGGGQQGQQRPHVRAS